MSKPFFDVFPKLKVRKDLQDFFTDTQVLRLASNREKTRLKVCLQSDHLIHKEQVFRMQKEMGEQLFGGHRVEVYIEEHYRLSEQYTPKALMEAYSDSIVCEISSYSPVMGVFFRDARITYGTGGNIDICMRNTCISRDLQERLEESLNRIFRERCGVPATLTVTLEKTESSDPYGKNGQRFSGASPAAGNRYSGSFAAKPDVAAAFATGAAASLNDSGFARENNSSYGNGFGGGNSSSYGTGNSKSTGSGNSNGSGSAFSRSNGRKGRFGKEKRQDCECAKEAGDTRKQEGNTG